ncbi:MAG: hypothetical protein J07HQX50_01432 [Haloquadratum sp. J07HQX50]|nr:MAG: hypothetical protein J07HQX50_01432 [Haloquadratum sp. J07HQX50]
MPLGAGKQANPIASPTRREPAVRSCWLPDEDQIHYDPTDHGLPGHIDCDSDRVETKDGAPVTRETTLVDIENPHRVARSRDPEPGEHRLVNSELDTFLDQDSDDSAALSVIGLNGATACGTLRGASPVRSRLRREWNEHWVSNGGAAPDATRFEKGVMMHFLLFVFPLVVNFGL